MPDDPGESSAIAALLRACPPRGALRIPPGDDAAVLHDGLTLSTDLLVEGVHFDHRLSPADVGWKAVAVNVSDLGAMGARPAWLQLGLSPPRPLDLGWVEQFAHGMAEALTHWGLELSGGDTTRSPGPRMVSVTVGGHCGQPVARSGGRAGDRLWVTGRLGASAAGFHRAGTGRSWLRRPDPPVAFGVAVAEAGLAHAMMDLSDGLATDLPRLCAASGVGAEVDPEALPLHPATLDGPAPLREATAWGEDYQLLLAAEPSASEALRALAKAHGVELTPIGRLHHGEGATMGGQGWPTPDFAHFGAIP